MSDWDNLVEPTRGALEALLRKGDEMADRIEELEAKLAKAVLALQLIDEFTNTHDQRAVAIEMLAELKGQNQ
jgi:hypothetical protein